MFYLVGFTGFKCNLRRGIWHFFFIPIILTALFILLPLPGLLWLFLVFTVLTVFRLLFLSLFLFFLFFFLFTKGFIQFILVIGLLFKGFPAHPVGKHQFGSLLNIILSNRSPVMISCYGISGLHHGYISTVPVNVHIDTYLCD